MQIIKIKNSGPSTGNFLKHVIKGSLFESAATLSYYFLFSVFPLAIFCSAVFSTLHISEESISYLNKIVPTEILNLFSAYLREISLGNTFSLMAIGMLLTLYSMGKVIQVLKRRIRKSYEITPQNAVSREWIVSLIFVLLMLLSLYASLILIVAGNQIITWITNIFPSLRNALPSFHLVRTLTVAMYLFFVLLGIYYVLPGFKQRVMDVLPGTLFALTTWILASFLFSLYIDRFVDFSMLYGSLGTIIALLTWLYLINMILLIGANINSYIYHQKRVPRYD